MAPVEPTPDLDALRRELLELMDTLALDPPQSLAERARLVARRDEVSAALRAASPTNGLIESRWAERAARSVQDSPGRTPHIASHGEGGGSGA